LQVDEQVQRRIVGMWDIILWFVIGGGVGWLAQRYVALGRPGQVTDIVVGALSALVVNVILSALIPGYFSITTTNVLSLLIAFIAAVVGTSLLRIGAVLAHSAKA
jgi:uncharacterized membrane protein YeaQ/YmgE (transglycosylase-associated protein family)